MLSGVVLLVLFGNMPTALGVGAMWASVAWMLVIIVMQVAGTAPRLMGGTAEAWTAQELKALGSQWHVTHNVLLQYGDADHVLVGPAGVFVVETKWSASRRFEPIISTAVRQARKNAEDVRHRLRAYHGVVHTTPVVVLWGRHAPQEPSEQEGVVVLHGSTLVAWADGLDQNRMSAEEVEGCDRGLRQYLAVRARDPSTTAPSRYIEAGLTGVVADVASGTSAGFSVLLAGAYAWGYLALPLALLATVALAGIGLLGRRHRRLSAAGLGVTVGAGAVLVLMLVTYALDWIT